MPASTARRRAAGLLAEVGLREAADRPARTLSGGELQRLAVVRALTSTRPLVLADEPTNQLDRENAARVMALLLDAARRDERAVVVVTHDVDALPATCRVLGLGPGGLQSRTPA